MIYESIRQYLGSQNFALVSTNVPELCVLRNINGTQGIFCVIADHTRSRYFSPGQLSSVGSQLASHSSFGSMSNDILFIVITYDTVRDRALAQSGMNVWLADAASGTLIIYEDQPDDFYGLRDGIEAAIVEGSRSQRSAGGGPVSRGTSVLRKNFPTVTVILIALNVIYFIVLAALGNTQNMGYMLAMGANYSELVFKEFQLWRLVTCMFMHFGISHLVSNMVYLGICGYNLERVTGHLRFLLIYMLSGIGSSVVSAAYYYLTDQLVVSAGASGAIYGLVGAIAYLTFRSIRSANIRTIFWRAGVILIFVFYSSFLRTGVDGAAHIGGFIFGLILGISFINRQIKRGG